MNYITRSLKTLFVVIATMTISSCSPAGPEKGVGLQLWSVREAMQSDAVGAIERIGAMGYDYVESAGYSDGKIYGMKPTEFKALVEKNGMIYRGAHTGQAVPDSGGWEILMPWWDECIAAHKEAGVEYIVQPFMGQSGYGSLAGLAAYCEYFNAVGQKCNEAGIKFGYHNHDREFSELEGEVIYDYLLENTNPEHVFFQLDLYWILEGGASPEEYIEKNTGRFLSFHIKDEKELGESGEIDFKPLLDLAEKAGAIYHVVEVERYNHEPLVSVEKSLDHLREIGFTN